jgi:hypothetical protein
MPLFQRERTRPEWDRCGDSPRVEFVLEGIATALQLARDAEEAQTANVARAGKAREMAEWAHYRLLGWICQLSEANADRVEPAFSELESRLERLSRPGS